MRLLNLSAKLNKNTLKIKVNEYKYYLDMIEIVGCCGKCFDLIRIPAGHLDKTFLLHKGS